MDSFSNSEVRSIVSNSLILNEGNFISFSNQSNNSISFNDYLND